MAHKYKLIACDILYRELCWLLATTPHIVDVQFMKKGLHDMGAPKMSSLLQEALDAVPEDEYEAILLGYGLCGNGIQGLHCHLPLVVPRCHDCITLLLGSRKRYRRFFDEHPGTYFRSTGWIEREHPELLENGQLDSTMTQLGLSSINYAELIEKYGERTPNISSKRLGERAARPNTTPSATWKCPLVTSPVMNRAPEKRLSVKAGPSRGARRPDSPEEAALGRVERGRLPHRAPRRTDRTRI